MTPGNATNKRTHDFGIHRGVSAYPLSWPASWKRTPGNVRKRAAFSRRETVAGSSPGTMRSRSREMTISEALDRLEDEMRKLGIDWQSVVISTNMRTRLDGLPMSGAKEPDDPGVAVYFNLESTPHCLPCDRWLRVADNIAAIAAHIGAMRGMERWGVGDVQSAFAGFKALPPPSGGGPIAADGMTVEQALEFVLARGGGDDARGRMNIDDLMTHPAFIKDIYRAAARRLHPDAGGSDELFNKLQDARRIVEQALAKEPR